MGYERDRRAHGRLGAARAVGRTAASGGRLGAGPGGTVEILPSADVDLAAAERKRAAERARLEAEIERAERKLANEGFVDKAPGRRSCRPSATSSQRLRAELEAL